MGPFREQNPGRFPGTKPVNADDAPQLCGRQEAGSEKRGAPREAVRPLWRLEVLEEGSLGAPGGSRVGLEPAGPLWQELAAARWP